MWTSTNFFFFWASDCAALATSAYVGKRLAILTIAKRALNRKASGEQKIIAKNKNNHTSKMFAPFLSSCISLLVLLFLLVYLASSSDSRGVDGSVGVRLTHILIDSSI